MLVLLIAAESALFVFLVGVLLIAHGVTFRHGDPSAMYKLYAVRDGLIDACVFKGVPRNNRWLDVLYENVNSILVHSNLLGGPARWNIAIAVGHYQAKNPNVGRGLRPLPQHSDECPDAIRLLGPQLQSALQHLVDNHMGLFLQMDARERERRRIQREKAKDLLRMIRESPGCGQHPLLVQ